MLSRFFKKSNSFSSAEYWENRYKSGGNSGAGSYNKFAAFKAGILNAIVLEYKIQSVIEFGCSDGNQLNMLNLPNYVGLDVSPTILGRCIQKFCHDKSKSFFLYNPECFVDNRSLFVAEAAFSIDVIFHLVEQNVFDAYLAHLFGSALKLVVIYGADIDHPRRTNHELYRKFTGYISDKFPDWKLIKVVKNKYPAKDYDDENGSLADFYFFIKG